MSQTCSLRIPTQDLGLGNYYTIPLAGKASYKVANHSNNRSMCFSIRAYTWDALTNKAVAGHATAAAIDLALVTLGGVKVSSATGRGHVNVKAFTAKEGNTVTRKAGFTTGGWMSGLMGSIGAIQSWNKLVEKPEDNPKQFVFGVTAHKTADTKITFAGEVTLAALADKLAAEGAWGGDGSSLVEMATTAYEKTSTLNELKKYFWG